MYNVIFENSINTRKKIGQCETQNDASKIILKFLKNKNYKSYYQRYSSHGDTTTVDVGSHTEFFYIVKQGSKDDHYDYEVVFSEFSGETLAENQVMTICYNQKVIWETREEAIRFFKEGASCSDGHEKLRYLNILDQLASGEYVCKDIMEDD